jgi:hypothetical protein
MRKYSTRLRPPLHPISGSTFKSKGANGFDDSTGFQGGGLGDKRDDRSKTSLNSLSQWRQWLKFRLSQNLRKKIAD